jgi:hypothetical protein
MWGAIIGLAANAIGGAMQANSAKKAAGNLSSGLDVRKQAGRLGFSLEDVYGTRLQAPEFGFSEEDIYRITKKLARYNAGEGTDLANQSAGKVNAQTLDDLEAGMRRLFGGGDTFDTTRSKVNQNMNDWLDGRLSQPARKLLARRALSTGASGIGKGAVDDLYAGYLGVATEDIVGRGMDTYRSMYSMYRQSFPLVTGAQMMPYTTLTPEAGVNAAFQTAVAKYEADLNAAMAAAAPDPVASGLLADEMRRIMAVSAAQEGAGAMMGGLVSSVGGQAAGMFGGQTGGI